MSHKISVDKRPYVRIYLSEDLMKIVRLRAIASGLTVTQYVKYVILKEIDPSYEYKLQKMIEDFPT